MHEIMFAAHIIGALIVLAMSGYGVFTSAQKIVQFNLVRNLCIVTFGQAVSGFLVSATSPVTDPFSYCVRGIAYFSLVAISLAVMSFRTKTFLARDVYAYSTLSLALYFVPLLPAWLVG